MAGIDISSIVSAGGDVLAGVQKAITAVTSGGAAIQQSYEQSSQSAKDSANLAGIITGVQQAGKLTAEKAINDYAVQVQGDMADAKGRQAKLANEFLSTEDERSQMLTQIQQKQAINPLEDPIGWIHSKLTIDNDIQQYNLKGQQSQAAFEQTEAINKLIDVRASALSKLQQTVTTESAAAATKLVVNKAMEQSLEYDRQGRIANTQMFKDVASLSASALTVRAQVMDSQIRVQNLALEQQRLVLAQKADSRAEAGESREQAKFKQFLQDKSDSEQNTLDFTAAIKRGMIASGLSDDSVGIMNPSTIRNMAGGKTALDPKLAEYLRLGQLNIRAFGDDTSTRILGADPVSAIATINTLRPKLSADAQYTFDRINKQAVTNVTTSQVPAVQAVLATKDKDRISQLINDEAQRLLNSDSTHVTDPKSVYYLPGIPRLVEMIPGLKDLKTYKKILEPAILAGVALDDPKAVASLYASKVLTLEVNLNDAAVDIGVIYKSSQDANLRSKQAMNLGLTPKVSYTSEGVDYANSGEVTRELMRLTGINAAATLVRLGL